jgi:hypothetical protein
MKSGSADNNMVDRSKESLDFLNTLGREFCAALEDVVPSEDMSPQDCYSVIAPFLRRPVRPDALRELTPGELAGLVGALNKYFECDNIQLEHIQTAIAKTLWHWSPRISE